MTYRHASSSADGRFELQIEEWEARNTHWVSSPKLFDTTHAKVLFQPEGPWSVDKVEWTGTQLRLALRKYPGGQARSTLITVIDCEREVAQVEVGEEVPLSALESELDRFLSIPR